MLAFLLTLSLFAIGEKPKVSVEHVLSPNTLIAEATSAARNFSYEEQADILLRLAEASQNLDPKLAKRDCLQLFRISIRFLPQGPYRAAMQKNALQQLSTLDPDEAASLYTQMDTPDQWKQSTFSEDYRAFGARTLFPELWRKHKEGALDTISSIANWLGSTGQYPYTAIAPIIKDLAATDPDRAAALFSQAPAYVPRNQRFANTDREFVDFLLTTQHSVPGPLMKSAIGVALKSIDENTRRNDRPKFNIQVTSPQGKRFFNSESDFLISRLLPVIEKVDPAKAAELKEQAPGLQGIASDARITGAAVPSGTTASPSSVANALNESRFLRAQTMAQNDPRQAAEFANAITDPGLRAAALAAIAPAYSAGDPQKSKDWMKQAEVELESTPLGKLKLRLLISIAETKIAERDPGALLAIERAMALGEELFTEDMRANPGKMAYNAEGLEELEGLVRLSLEDLPDPEPVVLITRNTRDDLLRARLLVAAATGLASRKQPIHSPASTL